MGEPTNPPNVGKPRQRIRPGIGHIEQVTLTGRRRWRQHRVRAGQCDDLGELMGLVMLFAVAAGLIVVVGVALLYHAMLHPHRKTYGFALAHGLPTQPEELGLEAEPIELTLTDGHTSPGWIITGREPDGPTIVMTHGWSSSRYTALWKASLLARFAGRVVLYDTRGHGESSAPICHMGTTEAIDLLNIAEQLPPAAAPLMLYGSSMGAGTAIVAAARSVSQNGRAGRPPIAGVIADGPYRRGMEPVLGKLRNDGYPAFPIVHLAWTLVTLRLGGFGDFDRARHAGRLPCPLLVLHGTADRISRPASARQIVDAAGDATLIEFEGAAHGQLATHDEPRYCKAVATFVEHVMQNHRGRLTGDEGCHG